jgi:lipopolysaccharide cholinephosphotransferase
MNTKQKPDFQTLFPDEREKGETVLRQSQLVMLRMFKIFDYLCRKHDIRYFLTGGTLLGAIRHNGFIPWDDDLDVCISRDNYEKFVRLAVPELPNDIFFQNIETDAHYPKTCNVDARLRDKYSSYELIGRSEKGHLGLQVDIFIVDRAFFPNKKLIVIQNRLLLLLKDNRRRAKVLKWISKLPFKFAYSSGFIRTRREIGTFITDEEYKTLIRHKFEDAEAYIPLDYDSYLTRHYGNYMQLPPLEKRISHHNVIVRPTTPCDHKEILLWGKHNKRELAAQEK